MSWSISVQGTPATVVEALTAHAASLDGQSKIEYEDALPHLVAIAEQNFGEGEGPQITLTAHGHGVGNENHQSQRYLSVSLNA